MTYEATQPQRRAEPFARNSIADLHERLGNILAVNGKIARPQRDAATAWDASQQHLRGLTIDAYVRQPAPAPTDVNHANVARINADWIETERLIEAARVEHGFCSPAFKKAYRQILTRPGA